MKELGVYNTYSRNVGGKQTRSPKRVRRELRTQAPAFGSDGSTPEDPKD